MCPVKQTLRVFPIHYSLASDLLDKLQKLAGSAVPYASRDGLNTKQP
jgi:hypothetical protein